jgi:hypothetical protein
MKTIRVLGKAMRGRLPLIFGVVSCLAFSLAYALGQTTPEPDPSESPNQLEYNVKAAFLYSFGRYVEWPEKMFEKKDSPFVIGIYGKNPFGKALDRIAQTRTIQGRHIAVRIIESIDDLAKCHIVFIPSSLAAEKQDKIIKKIKDEPFLLVGEIPHFAEMGGDMNFFMDGESVRFEINVDTIRRKKIQIDAKLLNLGKKFSTETQR